MGTDDGPCLKESIMLSSIMSGLKSFFSLLYHALVGSFRGYIAMLVFMAVGSLLAWGLFAIMADPGFILCYIVVTSAMCLALYCDHWVREFFTEPLHDLVSWPFSSTDQLSSAATA